MTKRHLFSLNAPSNWPIEKKKYKWIIRPNPGPHPLFRSIPLAILLKNLLKYARTSREVKNILNSGEILINNRVRKDPKFVVGIMDIIEIKKTNEIYMLIINERNKYELIKLSKAQANIKPCKIINKTILGKGKIQLNLYDGRNLLVDNNEYKVGDTILLDLEKNKILEHLKLGKGSTIYIMDGKYTGYIGKVNDIILESGMKANKIIFTKDKEKIETLKDYAFVIPQDLFKK